MQDLITKEQECINSIEEIFENLFKFEIIKLLISLSPSCFIISMLIFKLDPRYKGV